MNIIKVNYIGVPLWVTINSTLLQNMMTNAKEVYGNYNRDITDRIAQIDMKDKIKQSNIEDGFRTSFGTILSIIYEKRFDSSDDNKDEGEDNVQMMLKRTIKVACKPLHIITYIPYAFIDITFYNYPFMLYLSKYKNKVMFCSLIFMSLH